MYTSSTYTSLPSPVSPEPASMAVDITLSSYPLSSPTLPLIDETMVDLVSELDALPARRPRTPRIRRVLHPSAPSAPSALFEIARDPIDQLVMYVRRHPKRKKRLHLVGLIDICRYLYMLIFVYIFLYIYMIWFIYEIRVSCLLNWL